MIGVALLALALQAQEPVRVTARLSAEQVEAGETTTFRVEVETGGARAHIRTFPNLPPGLELVGTRDSDHRQFSLPGGTRRFVSRDFVLRSRVPGRYRIPSVEVTVDERTYSSPSGLLVVTPARAGAAAEAESPVGADGVQIRAWIEADTVYVGQQVTVTVETLFSQEARLRLRRAPEYEAPSPSGFWVHDITGPRAPSTRMYGGRPYEVQTFRRALFPITPGQYEIPPARLIYEMRRGILNAPETFTAESEPLRLVVLPIPVAGRPDDFPGAVGRYRATGRIEPTRVPAGDPVVLTVEVDGVGDVKTLPPPRLPDIPGLEVSPPGEQSETELRGDRLAGTKRFTWVLIPREPGELRIPEIVYPYFDPVTGRFDDAPIAPLRLTVEPAAASATAPAAGAAAPTLRYMKAAPAPRTRTAWVRSPWFAAAQLAPLLLVAGAAGVRRVRLAPASQARNGLRRRRRAGMDRLAALARDGDVDGALAGVDAFARSWVAERFGINLAADNGATDSAADPKALVELRSVLRRAAEARYAPVPAGPDEARALVSAVDALLERLDRPSSRARRPGRADARAGLGLLLAAGAITAGVAPAGAQQPFAEGIAAFDDGRPADAAAFFDRHLELNPADPAAWYNLGTAYAHAGHDGYAVWALLQAVRLDPRDADARQNLRAAGARPELVRRVTPRLPLSPEEFALLASAAWLLAGLAGAGLVLRRSPWLTGVTAAALAVAVTAAALAWDAGRDPATGVILEPTRLRTAPTLAGAGVASLPAGEGVVLLERREGWVRARTLGDADGWIEAELVGVIRRR